MGTVGKEDAKIAITEVREGGSAVRHVSWGHLRLRAGRAAAAMEARGVRRGDRVVVVGANSVETAVVWLAATWVGAVFSSSSTDMGVKGILQRTVQVNPKVSLLSFSLSPGDDGSEKRRGTLGLSTDILPQLLFFDDAALYNGKTVDLRAKMTEVVEGLKKCSEFDGVVVIPRFSEPRDISGVPRAETWASFLARAARLPTPEFVRVPFHEPFLICYSSGTTGNPKAIVHSVGGAMINYFKEGRLHEGNGPDSVALQYTTVGWIMYLANVGILLLGGRSVMYDGSPFQPDAKTLLRVVEEQKVTKLGISPRWMFELAKNGISPREIADMSSLRIVTCTGMVLSDQLFEWFYDKGFPKNVHLANISGGTDIVSSDQATYIVVGIVLTPWLRLVVSVS